MKLRRLLWRYRPIGVLVVVQVLIIALVPSTAPSQSAVGSGSLPQGSTIGYSGSAAGRSGDRSHCAGNREFPTTIDYYAPLCTPGTVGGTYANGGNTYQGVSSRTVTVVDYYADPGGAVDAIAKAQGLYVSYDQEQQVDRAFQNFINSHYVLWGRQLKIEMYRSACQTVPPDYSCLLADMNTVVQTRHPYAVFWQTTLCSACFARLAQDHTVAIGGVGFSDAFAQANAPYFWSAGESSTHIEQAFARFWCNQLTSKNSSRVVSFAPDRNPAQDFNGRKRVLGVISTNDPDNEDTVTNVLVPALNRDCGDGGSVAAHHYYYAQDISTAAQQINAGISAMNTPNNPATDVVCLCDPVAPLLLYGGEGKQNYWPETVVADVQGIGTDIAGQAFKSTEFDYAFGIMSSASLGPPNSEAGPQVYRLGGGTNLPMQPYVATADWASWNMLASLIQNTGPDLSPTRMAAMAPSMGTIGGGTTGHAELGFSPGSYNWTIDARVAYWDQGATSSYNGRPGAFIDIEGSRFLPDQYRTLPEPPVPKVRSS